MWVRYYPPSTFPSLWKNLETLIETETLISSEEVLQELSRKEDDRDDFLKWAKQNKALFKPVDEDVQKAVENILTEFPNLVNVQKQRSEGDPFVIATAQVYEAIIVSGERATGKLNKPKIPDVCRDLGIRCITTLELIQSEKWIF